jgi:hypothetical protein
MKPLAICTIFRDETPYFLEWLRFHQTMGVEHFFLYDNESEDNPEAFLAPYIESGLVTLISWPLPFDSGAQIQAYADCLTRTRGLFRWVAFIDMDEFLFSPTRSSLPEMLSAYAGHPGVVVHWQCYGSDGHQSKTDEPVTTRFTRRAPTHWVRNRRVKSIVNPERALAPLSVHLFSYQHDGHPVDETGNAVTYHPKPKFKKKLKKLYGFLGPLLRYLPVDPYTGIGINTRQVRAEKLRINHYPVKSHEEFLRKARFQQERRRYEDVDYFAYHDRNDIQDTILVGWELP